MTNMIYEKEQKAYWNDKEVVDFFSNNAASDYWIDFIEGEKIQGKILDLGCGGGRNFSYFASKHYDVYACDLHENMVSATKKKVEKLVEPYYYAERVLQANVLELPYSKDQFKVVIANGLFHNLENVELIRQGIAEATRVLESSGYLCLNMFTNEIVADNLKSLGPDLYMTPDGVSMILLSPSFIVRVLEDYHMSASSEIHYYASKVFSGTRSVIRGVFKKHQ